MGVVDRHVVVPMQIRNGYIWTSSLARNRDRCDSHSLQNKARPELKTLYQSKRRPLRHSLAAARMQRLLDHKISNSLTDRRSLNLQEFHLLGAWPLVKNGMFLAILWQFLLSCASSRTCFLVPSLPASFEALLSRFCTPISCVTRFREFQAFFKSVCIEHCALLWHLRNWCVFRRSRRRCFSGNRAQYEAVYCFGGANSTER